MHKKTHIELHEKINGQTTSNKSPFRELSFRKNLFCVALSLCLFSCQTALDKKNNPAQNNGDGKDSTKSTYETINSEEQAKQINQGQEEVEVNDRVFFSLNSSEINDEAKKTLDVQAEWLRSDKTVNVTIEGHCDERGSREFNIALGEKRAFAVKKYLKQKGVAEARVKIVSYGKERPAFIGDSEEIHAKNRRAVTVTN